MDILHGLGVSYCICSHLAKLKYGRIIRDLQSVIKSKDERNDSFLGNLSLHQLRKKNILLMVSRTTQGQEEKTLFPLICPVYSSTEEKYLIYSSTEEKYPTRDQMLKGC